MLFPKHQCSLQLIIIMIILVEVFFFQSQFEYSSFETLKLLLSQEGTTIQFERNQQEEEKDDYSWLKDQPFETEKSLKSIFKDFALSEEETESSSSDADEYSTTSDENSFSKGNLKC